MSTRKPVIYRITRTGYIGQRTDSGYQKTYITSGPSLASDWPRCPWKEGQICPGIPKSLEIGYSGKRTIL